MQTEKEILEDVLDKMNALADAVLKFIAHVETNRKSDNSDVIDDQDRG
jgi:hypothetical protein